MGNLDDFTNNGEGSSNTKTKVVGLTKAYSDQIDRKSRIHDHLILDRLNQYLNENKHQTYVDISVITEALRRRYREYRRRSWSDFKKLVERAFAEVSKAAGYDLEESCSSSSEIEECDNSLPVNTSNSQVTGLYRKEQKKSNDMELINLSSSEDEAPKVNSGEQVDDDERIPSKLRKNPEVSVTRRRHPIHRNTRLPANLVFSTSKFSDFGGNKSVLEEVCRQILHLRHPAVFRTLGVSAPRGFLLHGPPGCGKTLLASAIAGELKLPLIKISGPELVGGVSGESEERVRELFTNALSFAPCILFIDEVDAVTPNRQTAQREMERRIVAQLITSLDDLAVKDENGQVLVIGATKRPDALDPALRRAGRFDREVSLGIPDEKARLDILKILCAKVPLSKELDLTTIARMTPGFVGADLLSLIRESAMVAITRVFEQMKRDKCEKINRKRKIQVSEEVENPKRATVEETKNDEINVEELKSDAEASSVEVQAIETDVVKEAAKSEDKVTVNGDATKETKDVDVVEMKNESSENISVDIDVEAEPKVVTAVAEEVEVEPVEDDKSSITHNIDPLTTLLECIQDASTSISSAHLKSLTITGNDLNSALKSVQPSAKREGFATVPGVTWEDVGSLASVREHLKMTILGPVKYQSEFEKLGLVAPAGVLLCGPPGCGKTLLAKAVANEAGINFISVKGPELLNMYVGESERAVRTVFQRARNSAPCVIFFDELDALCPRRNEGDAGAGMRVVNQMLTEMDGVGERRGVFLMAATNRPDIVDPAVLRPGRLDKTIYIGLPNADDRKDILRAITKSGTRPPLAEGVSLDELAERPELNNWSGADLAALMRESAMNAMRDVITEVTLASDGAVAPKNIAVTVEHIERSLRTVKPSISRKDLVRYEEMRMQFEGGPDGT